MVLEVLRQRFNAGERHLDADHIIPIEEKPELRLVLDNYQTLCDRCHIAKTLHES
jgi:5-methylcytosine-specific restriction endonuclease McrA